MTLSKDQIEQLIEENRLCVEKVISRSYRHMRPEIKEDLRQAGMVGLWKGILRYYARESDGRFDREVFQSTLYAYIRYEIKEYFIHSFDSIRITSKAQKNWSAVKSLQAANPGLSEPELSALARKNGLKYDWYRETEAARSVSSIDKPLCKEENDGGLHELISQNDMNIKAFLNEDEIAYIVHSAMAGVKKERDKIIIRTWLMGIYRGREPNHPELGKRFGLSPSMIGVILNRFVMLCRFVIKCEKTAQENPNGSIMLPVAKGENITYKGQKIPGIKWALRNRKWIVSIYSQGKNILIGYFKEYSEAVAARRNAEIKYRGKSDIVL